MRFRQPFGLSVFRSFLTWKQLFVTNEEKEKYRSVAMNLSFKGIVHSNQVKEQG